MGGGEAGVGVWGIRASVWDDNQVLGIVVTAGQQWDVINAPRMYSENGTLHCMLHALYHSYRT